VSNTSTNDSTADTMTFALHAVARKK